MFLSEKEQIHKMIEYFNQMKPHVRGDRKLLSQVYAEAYFRWEQQDYQCYGIC